MRIIDTIRKLIAHERSARKVGSLQEAEAFAAKIQQLLLEYKLSLGDVEQAANPMGHEEAAPPSVSSRVEKWCIVLANAVADGFSCSAIAVRRSNIVIFVGREAERLTAVMTWTYLMAEARELCSAEVARERQARPRKRKFGSFRASFYLGFSSAIDIRLRKNRQQFLCAQSDPQKTLALFDRDRSALKQYAAKTFDDTSTMSAKRKLDKNAFWKGYVKGLEQPISKRAALPEVAA